MTLAELFRRGDLPLIHLLEHCVLSVAVEPLFLFLVHEFRTMPTAARATAMFDLFCAVDAPARLPREQALPPFELQLARSAAELARAGAPAPPRYLFDDLARGLADGQAREIEARFDPALGPYGSFPGGQPPEAGRQFLRNVWQPKVRPRLIAAGFWRVANVGG